MGHPEAEESPVGKVVMYSSVSVDGFIADEHDQPRPLLPQRVRHKILDHGDTS